MKTISLKEIESYFNEKFKEARWNPSIYIHTEAQAKLFSNALKEIIAKYESQNKFE